MSTDISQATLCRSKTQAGGYRLPDELYNVRWAGHIRSRSIIDPVKGCWLWQGFIHGNGYGMTTYRGKSGRLHRQSFAVFKGPIPAGHDVCHSCDVRNCWNPDHLFSGTRKQNHDDMWAKGRAWQQKDACRRGHPYALHAYTTPYAPTWRRCRLCDRIAHRLQAGWSLDEAINTPVAAPGQPTARRSIGARK